MKILLVSPRSPATFWSFSHALPFVGRKAPFPPLGLLTIAPLLPFEWSKRLVDLNVEPLTDEHLNWADMVFVGAMLVQLPSVREIVARAKAFHRPVVAGGPAFTTGAEPFEGIDHVVLGEAEITLPRFLADLRDGVAAPVYESIERPELVSTPIPEWTLVDPRNYAAMLIQYSRGCPFECEFCDIRAINGRRQRVKTPEQMVAEIQALYDRGWRGSIFFVDDNFVGNWRHSLTMLPHVIEWQKAHRYPFTFLTQASVNLAAHEQLLRRMADANFYKVFVGIETPSLKGLRECRKHQNVLDLHAATRTLQAHGLQVMAGFILGFDSDVPSIFRRQVAFIQESGIVLAMVGLLSALPGTKLWDRLAAEGRLCAVASGNNTDGTLNFVPRMRVELLLDGYRRVLATLASPRNYYRRVRAFLRHYRSSVRSRTTWDDLRAFARSVWRIGIRSRARFHYWYLLLWTLLRNPRAFAIAVELCIYQVHFERIAAQLTAREGIARSAGA